MVESLAWGEELVMVQLSGVSYNAWVKPTVLWWSWDIVSG